jgi:hypothetical protein
VLSVQAVPGGSITLGGNGSSDMQYFVLACPTLPTTASGATATGTADRPTLSSLGGGSQSRGLTRQPTRRRSSSKRRHSTVELAILEQRRQRAQHQQQSRECSHVINALLRLSYVVLSGAQAVDDCAHNQMFTCASLYHRLSDTYQAQITAVLSQMHSVSLVLRPCTSADPQIYLC